MPIKRMPAALFVEELRAGRTSYPHSPPEAGDVTATKGTGWIDPWGEAY